MPHKLLLADDSVTIQRVIELTFADQDVQVLTAGDGEQAIARIESERPDIVLADIGMPKRSGYEVAAFVKGRPDLSHIPVLLLTGAFEPVDQGKAQATGCDGVLVKPFEPQHVIARVRELLHSVRGSTARSSGTATRAVADIPRPAERLAPPRAIDPPAASPAAAGDNAVDFGLPARDADRGGPERSLDDYFDRLDAAFANIGSAPPDAAAAPSEAGTRHEGPVLERDLDWFDSPAQPAPASPPAPFSAPAAPPPEPAPAAEELPSYAVDVPPAGPPVVEPIPAPAPATFASPPRPLEWPLPQPASIEPPETPAERAPQPARSIAQPAAAGPGSTIADAFAALLAAEQGEQTSPVRLAVGDGARVVTDELAEEVTRRVIERLGRAAVRGVVADVVSEIAERLVREEIDRIRNKAK